MTLSLHPAIKSFLTISAKNAVFAILTNSALMLQWHSIFNFDNWPGVWAVARATFAVIASREALVWLPKLLKWSQTGADANDLQSALEHAADANKQVAVANKEVATAIAEAKQEAPKP